MINLKQRFTSSEANKIMRNHHVSNNLLWILVQLGYVQKVGHGTYQSIYQKITNEQVIIILKKIKDYMKKHPAKERKPVPVDSYSLRLIKAIEIVKAAGMKVMKPETTFTEI